MHGRFLVTTKSGKQYHNEPGPIGGTTIPGLVEVLKSMMHDPNAIFDMPCSHGHIVVACRDIESIKLEYLAE